jgi:hypothetical protein
MIIFVFKAEIRAVSTKQSSYMQPTFFRLRPDIQRVRRSALSHCMQKAFVMQAR